MAHTTQANIEHTKVVRQYGPFKVTIRDNDRINIVYPCGYAPQGVNVLTGHGVKHATWQIVDDFEKHSGINSADKKKKKCDKCIRTVRDGGIDDDLGPSTDPVVALLRAIFMATADELLDLS